MTQLEKNLMMRFVATIFFKLVNHGGLTLASPMHFSLGNETLMAIRKEINKKKLSTLGDNCIKSGKSRVLNNKLLKNMFLIRSKSCTDLDDDSKMKVHNQMVKKNCEC